MLYYRLIKPSLVTRKLALLTFEVLKICVQFCLEKLYFKQKSRTLLKSLLCNGFKFKYVTALWSSRNFDKTSMVTDSN